MLPADERAAIEGWLRQCGALPTSPMSGADLEHSRLIPNVEIAEAIHQWQRQQAQRIG